MMLISVFSVPASFTGLGRLEPLEAEDVFDSLPGETVIRIDQEQNALG